MLQPAPSGSSDGVTFGGRFRSRACHHGPMNNSSRQARSEQRRHEIIQAAIEVFGNQGYRQGSLRAVAAAIGLTVQGVLHYFPTKEDLLLAALESRTMSRQLAAVTILEEEGTVAYLRYFLEQNLLHPGFMRLFVTLAAEASDEGHPAREYFLDRYASSHEAISKSLAEDIARGRSTAHDPRAAAEQLVALADGLQLQYLLRPGMDLLRSYDNATSHLVREGNRAIPESI